jgi:hypothetical protein
VRISASALISKMSNVSCVMLRPLGTRARVDETLISHTQRPSILFRCWQLLAMDAKVKSSKSFKGHRWVSPKLLPRSCLPYDFFLPSFRLPYGFGIRSERFLISSAIGERAGAFTTLWETAPIPIK